MRYGILALLTACSWGAPATAPEQDDAGEQRVIVANGACDDLATSAGSSRDKVYVFLRNPGTMEAACAAGAVTRTFTLPSPDLMVERYVGRHLIPSCSEWDPRERITGSATAVSGTVTVEVTTLPGATYTEPFSMVHVTLTDVQWQTTNGASLPIITPLEYTAEWIEIGYDTGAVTGAGPCTVL